MRTRAREMTPDKETRLAAFFLPNEHAQSAKMLPFIFMQKSFGLSVLNDRCTAKTLSEKFPDADAGLLLHSLLYGILFSGSLTLMRLMELKAVGWNTKDFHGRQIDRKADSKAQNLI